MNQVEINLSHHTAKLNELRYDDGQGPSVDSTREPWGQPVWRWGLSGGVEQTPPDLNVPRGTGEHGRQ